LQVSIKWCFLRGSSALIVEIFSGIAGASYIPAVQGGLARLLGAAAPPGTSARENRRQCLKVSSCSFCDKEILFERKEVKYEKMISMLQNIRRME
jgi:hypothetical protein